MPEVIFYLLKGDYKPRTLNPKPCALLFGLSGSEVGYCKGPAGQGALLQFIK